MNWFQKLSNWLFGTPQQVKPVRSDVPKDISLRIEETPPQKTITFDPKISPPIEILPAEQKAVEVPAEPALVAPEPVVEKPAPKPKAKKSTPPKPAGKKTSTRKKS
jgi:hypothetical protein